VFLSYLEEACGEKSGRYSFLNARFWPEVLVACSDSFRVTGARVFRGNGSAD
jgi:hypothetical protein